MARSTYNSLPEEHRASAQNKAEPDEVRAQPEEEAQKQAEAEEDKKTQAEDVNHKAGKKQR